MLGRARVQDVEAAAFPGIHRQEHCLLSQYSQQGKRSQVPSPKSFHLNLGMNSLRWGGANKVAVT